jgi:uroporphyrinogen decarboxylase
MTGRELVVGTLRHERLERAPWVPYACAHAGKLKGYTATEVLRDSGKLVESLLEANRLYRPDGQPVVFDIQLEAEALGCKLLWADKSPPSVIDHPLAGAAEIPSRMPGPGDGRIGMTLEAMGEMKDRVGPTTALYGLVTGPFTLASHLRGTDLFLDMILKPDYVRGLLEYCFEVERTVAGYYIAAGMDVIAAVDPMVSQISPAHFGAFLGGPYEGLFSYIREAGALSSFFVCGNASKNIEPMCLAGPDGISIDENIEIAEAKKTTDRHNVCLGGNIPLGGVMLTGSEADNVRAVAEILDSCGGINLVVSPGCDMPYDMPIENAIAAGKAVRGAR